MFVEGQRVKVLVDEAYSTERGQLGREGTVLHNDETSYAVTYVKMDGNNTDERHVHDERTACEVFGNEHLELVKQEEKEESVQKIKVGDTVKVIDTSGGHGKKLGETFKVKAIEHEHYSSKELIVLDDPSRARCAAYAERFKVVRAKPAKAKSQKITVDELLVGDETVAFFEQNGIEYRQKGIVGFLNADGKPCTTEGNFLCHHNQNVWATPSDSIYLLNRPEPKKPEIADGFYWVTEEGHHASPWKVTVANEKAEWETNEGRHVYGTYENLVAVKSGKYEMGTPVTKFHTEEPVKTLEDGIYTVQWRDSSDGWSTYYWVFKGGKAYEHSSLETARRKADNGGWEVSEHWVKQTVAGDSRLTVPVPYVESKPELTDLEKFEQAGLIGTRYRDSCNKHLQWKVTAKGNIKGKHLNVAGDVWEKVSFGFDTLQKYVAEGILVKI